LGWSRPLPVRRSSPSRTSACFKELEAKNRDLTDNLEQQTATAEILRVIASSPTDVQPVFETIAGKALDLCKAWTSTVFRFDGELVHLAASHSLSPEACGLPSAELRCLQAVAGAARAVLSRTILYISDIREDPEYRLQATAKAGGYLSVLAVPMLRQGQPIGAVAVGVPRQERFRRSRSRCSRPSPTRR
jgi:two-component system NtrC family sensor kinase